MASIITAGTTTGTALSLTSDTSGELQIKTNNGSTTALTLTTGGAATFTAGTVSAPAITTTGDTNTGIFFPAADTIAFSEGGTESMRINASGNLGLGVTPSAWSSFKALQVGAGTVLYNNSNANGSFLGSNFYWNGTNNIYIGTSTATAYGQTDGQHQWFNAPSGTAGNAITFTQAMTLDANGSLIAGGTSSPSSAIKFYAVGSGSANRFRSTSTTASGATIEMNAEGATGGALFVTTNHPMLFGTNSAERMRIDTSGYITSLPTYNNGSASGANMVVNSSGLFLRSVSALKYKQDVRDLESIDITKFRPVRYKSKCEGDDQEKDHFGVIADEVHEAGVTELVNYGAEGEVEGFQYERLTVVLLKQIQEQQAIITDLKARVEELEAQ